MAEKKFFAFKSMFSNVVWFDPQEVVAVEADWESGDEEEGESDQLFLYIYMRSGARLSLLSDGFDDIYTLMDHFVEWLAKMQGASLHRVYMERDADAVAQKIVVVDGVRDKRHRGGKQIDHAG